MYLIYKAKKLKIVKLKSFNQKFTAVCHHQGDDGKQLKTFGLDLLILQFLTF